MTVARPPQPTGDNFKTWGARLNDYLVRTRSQLVQYVAGTSAVDDGMLVWDADNSRVLYSYDGAWLPIAGTGSGTPASLFYNGAAKITATADGVTAFGNITLSGFPESSYELKGDIDGSVRFHAVASEALSKGDVVYIVQHASSGSETKVAKALASDAAKMPAFGLALDDAATDAAVQIVTFGNLYGSGGASNALDTSAYNSGTPLYVSATTAGEWTGTAPAGEANLIQNIGKVVRKQQTNGVIKVGGAGRTNATPNLNNGNFFIGNSSNQAVTASFATQVAAAEVNDLSTTVTWANVPDENITESSVTQHLTAANVTSPLTGGTGITIASDGTFTNSSPDQTVALTGTGATTVTGTYPNFTIDSTNTTYTVGDGGLTTNDFTDADHTKLNNIEANADVTDTANVTSAGALMDSEVTNLAQVKAFDSSDYLTSIANGSIDTDQLANSAVTNIKIEAGTITGDRINTATSIALANGTAPPFVSKNTNYQGAALAYKIQKTRFGGATEDHGGIGTTQLGYADSRYTYLSSGEIAVGVFSIFGGTGTGYSYFQPLTITGGNHSGKMRLGTSGSKWQQLYASTSTISTSDRNTKQQIETLSEAETRVATAAKGLLRKYKFNDAVEEKGDNARIHFGIVAQDLQDAFTAEGLDAHNYSMFCSDTWWEHEGETYNYAEAAPEGSTEITQLGVRYSELLAFIIAAL